MIALAALLLAAQAEPPPDPRCPQGDLQFPRPPGSVCIGRLTAGYAFAFIYPAEAAAMPPLVRLLRQEARRGEAWIAAQARDWRAERLAAGDDPSRLSYEAGWTVDAATPALVAASGTASYYAGGAHGGIDYRSILLDRRTGRRLALADLFSDSARALALVQQGFCQAVRAEVSERRDNDRSQPPCPDVAAQPVSLVAEARRIAAFQALLGPYVVGSYAEGPYEFRFPVTAETIALIKPRYRPAFALP